MGYLDGTIPAPDKTIEVVKADNKKDVVPNPEYDSWVAKGQQLLSYLLNSLTKDALAQVTSVKTSAEAWEALGTRFAAHSQARVTNLRMQLTNTKKVSMTNTAYFNKMMAIRDELAAVGKEVEDDEMVSNILNGLDFEYNAFVSSVLGRAEPISLSDLFSQLLAYDLRLEMYQGDGNYQSSANMAGRGHGGYRGCGNNRGRNKGGQGHNRGNNGAGTSAPRQGGQQGGPNSKPKCQIYKKVGHEAPNCWYWYDDDDEQ